MTITLGWWLAPTLVTVIVLGRAFWPETHDYHGADIVGAIKLMGGIIISLAAWLIWSLAA